MKIVFIAGGLVVILGVVAGTLYFLPKEKTRPIAQNLEADEIDASLVLVDFSKINPEFLFSAKIPKEFSVEYIPQLRAINVYNPLLAGENTREKSQVYISFFKAGRFLTLNTVDITRQDNMTIQGREAILYEITKKDGVPDFSGQPNWRNFKHQALDIRLTGDSPSYFYSFAYSPDLTEEMFNNIISSLVFTPETAESGRGAQISRQSDYFEKKSGFCSRNTATL